jgi:nucleoside-triphosphatase THEP1
MTYIISGKRNSGKTSAMEEKFNSLTAGAAAGGVAGAAADTAVNAAGFICKKIPGDSDNPEGYNLVDLSTKKEFPFIISIPSLIPGKKGNFNAGDFVFGRYLFLHSAIDIATDIFQKALETDVDIFFIDEIGSLELEGRGFADILTKATDSFKDIYIAVRSEFTEDVVNSFYLRECKILTP